MAAAIYLEEITAGSPVAPEIWQQWFEIWLAALAADIPPAESYELSLRLTGDGEIQQLNAQYRQQDEPTDVLSFAALEVEIPEPTDAAYSWEPLYLGDIVISLETAARQSQQQGHSLTVELAWLAAHGLLHLLGWDHPDTESLAAMLERQKILLAGVDLFSQYC
jgi:probable rRNA maturation factor